LKVFVVATVLTACGIETFRSHDNDTYLMHRCNSTYRLRYWNSFMPLPPSDATWACCNSTYRLRYATKGARQQRSDDEGRTSLVPDRRAGKTIEWKYLPLAVLKRLTHIEGDITSFSCNSTYRLRYWNGWLPSFAMYINRLQQYLPLVVLKLVRRVFRTSS